MWTDYSNIQIKDPIFGREKQKVMKESWLNILVSKSEPLCLVHAKSKSLKRVKSKIKKLSEIIIKI